MSIEMKQLLDDATSLGLELEFETMDGETILEDIYDTKTNEWAGNILYELDMHRDCYHDWEQWFRNLKAKREMFDRYALLDKALREKRIDIIDQIRLERKRGIMTCFGYILEGIYVGPNKKSMNECDILQRVVMHIEDVNKKID